MRDHPLTNPNIPPPLVEAMAKAGYEHMARVEVEQNHLSLEHWDAQSKQLREQWRGAARAMLDAWHDYIKGKGLPR